MYECINYKATEERQYSSKMIMTTDNDDKQRTMSGKDDGNGEG